MTRQEAIRYLEQYKYFDTCGQKSLEESNEAIDIAIKALQGDMYCPSCGVRLVSENEYVEPKPYKVRIGKCSFGSSNTIYEEVFEFPGDYTEKEMEQELSEWANQFVEIWFEEDDTE